MGGMGIMGSTFMPWQSRAKEDAAKTATGTFPVREEGSIGVGAVVGAAFEEFLASGRVVEAPLPHVAQHIIQS